MAGKRKRLPITSPNGKSRLKVRPGENWNSPLMESTRREILRYPRTFLGAESAVQTLHELLEVDSLSLLTRREVHSPTIALSTAYGWAFPLSRYAVQSIPSFLMRARSVCGLISSSAAAP